MSGGQGTGKSTVSAFICEALGREFGNRCVALSLDDFYLERRDRNVLAASVHPLLRTRGVPGTHDVDLLRDILARLAEGEGTVSAPVFDKSVDDRLPTSQWRSIALPVDTVILEGWCVGARHQSALDLADPINDLERRLDPDSSWRCFVNDRLERDYEPLFKSLDALVFLEAPNFDAIRRWRMQQEHELIAACGRGMSDAEIERFIEHYQRITQACLEDLPQTADVCVHLGIDHGVTGMTFNRDETPGS